jgi:DNA-binding CsgD family transcriptional regulator
LARRSWGDADQHLTEAREADELAAWVLEQLAVARLLIGRQEASEESWIEAHESFLRDGDTRGAARCAFWLGLLLVMRGEMARGGGWLGRAHEVLADHDECAESGLLLSAEGLHAMFGGHVADGESTFLRARELGERVGSPDVVAFGELGVGQCLMRQGRTAEGLAVLDRVMAGVEAEGLSPMVTGIVYCAVIEECQRIFDVARAREWTTGLSRWLGSQPDLVAFQGQCMVYRAEVVQRHGDWPAAIDESRRARDRLSTAPGHPATGLALYRLGELHRLRGEYDEADAAYREANSWGRSPQPGLALLRLGQGDIEAATRTIRRVLGDTSEPGARCEILAAAVRILLAAGDVDSARLAGEELTLLAVDLAAPFLQAIAEHCQGTVAVAQGQPAEGVGPLRSCLGAWLAFQAPHEEALTRIELGTAYHDLGDHDSGQLEFDTARTLLVGLGAAPDLARLDMAASIPVAIRGDLSLRELQVLRLLATGETNRSIAESLYISIRTVDRHVSNLYTKLGVSNRAAATAHAYEHQLI